MTTKTTNSDLPSEAALSRMSENLKKVEALTERLGQVMAGRQTHQASLDGPNQELFTKATQSYWSEALQNPAKLIEHQMGYWTKSVAHFMEAQKSLTSGKQAELAENAPKDRRFANPLWETHPYFSFVKKQYQINAEALKQAVDHVTDLEPREKQRLAYFSQQIIDYRSHRLCDPHPAGFRLGVKF